ncbi:hypothetical protein B0H17DRAFT_1266143 [Mycena rosella]|uniref:Uncharacterized protein n=1 Tax=Mycena rosella TaxID=1033263 RepID=A0AAD7G3H3_MYCRO|nr:hypothetical protein B0H17DRAFT_1266143 [Mycena rosella]
MSSEFPTSLTAAQKSHFLTHGFIPFTANLWTRLGMFPDEKSTWHTERTNMPSHGTAWSAICELVGGEDRISEETKRGVDGDFFLHFLNSPEQVLLVVPIFSDIAPGEGGTTICTDGIRVVARHLKWELTSDASFSEMTGAVGNVYLLHPLMVHSASKNVTRIPRVIKNPTVTLKAPFSFDSAGGSFSLVEQKTLQELGYPAGLEGWKIEGEREMIVPRRIKIQEEMKERERERLAREGDGDSTVKI